MVLLLAAVLAVGFQRVALVQPVEAHSINTNALCCPWPTESKYIRPNIYGNLPSTNNPGAVQSAGIHQGLQSSQSSPPWNGYSPANAKPYFGVVILDFGVQVINGGAYGTRVTGGSGAFASESYIHDAVVAYARGFYSNTPPPIMDPPKLRILVGTSNYTTLGTGGLTPTVAGQRWGSLVNSIGSTITANGWAAQITVSGAIDIEPSWSTVAWARTWISTYASTSTHTYYNYGSADSCYPDPPSNGSSCANQWVQDDVWYVSRGAPGVRGAIPQIYYEYPSGGGTDHFMSKQWQKLSLQGYVGTSHPGQVIAFAGVQTGWNLCPNQSTRHCYTPQEGWSELMYHLNNFDPAYHGVSTDPTQIACTSVYSTNPPSCHRTDQASIAWSTDWKLLTP